MNPAAPARIAQQSLLYRYEPLIGAPAVERVFKKARRLSGIKVLHVNSTHQGGGVAEILSSLTPLMNDVGIETEWLVIDGSPEFFAFTKDIHNSLHGDAMELTARAMAVHSDIAHANAAQQRLDQFDVIIVHDPQPLRLVELRDHQAWLWCCHIDLSAPFPDAWNYLAPAVNRYDAAVFSLAEYAQPLAVPQHFIMPAIDPFSLINQEMSPAESSTHLERYGIARDLPLVVQAGALRQVERPARRDRRLLHGGRAKPGYARPGREHGCR